jgi:hypothetical protein
MEEAALVCLESQSHQAGVALELHPPRDVHSTVTLFWEAVHPNAVKGWRDSIHATNLATPYTLKARAIIRQYGIENAIRRGDAPSKAR